MNGGNVYVSRDPMSVLLQVPTCRHCRKVYQLRFYTMATGQLFHQLLPVPACECEPAGWLQTVTVELRGVHGSFRDEQ